MKKYKLLNEDLENTPAVKMINNYKDLEKYNLIKFLMLRGDVILNQVLHTTSEFASFDFYLLSGETRLLVEVKNRHFESIRYNDILIEIGAKFKTFKQAIKQGIKPVIITFYTDCVVLVDIEKLINEYQNGNTEYQIEHSLFRANNDYGDLVEKGMMKLKLASADILIHEDFQTEL